MEFKSTRTGNSIYDEMKARLHRENSLEIGIVYERILSQEERQSELEKIEDKFISNLFKLDEVMFLHRLSDEAKEKFCKQKLYIEGSEISSTGKVNLILTTACIFTRIYEQIKHLNEEQLYLLGICMQNTELKEYPIYGKVLTDKHFIVRANELSRNNNGVLELEEDAFMFCDECNGCELSNPSYQKAMKLVLPIVHQ